MTQALDIGRVGEFAQRVIADQGIVFSGVMTYLGDKLGLYKALAGAGALSSRDLADRTGYAERYLREWLAAQAAAGYVTYDPVSGAYTLPAEHAAVLALDDSPAAVVGAVEATAAGWADADRIADAFRTGQGVPWDERDPRLFSGTERFYGAGYRAGLVDEWLPALDGVVDALRRGARVLDVGCGHGVPSLLIAEAFPASTVDGVDSHAPSIARASKKAADAGLADRARFSVASATDYARGSGPGWDLICFFDVLHDLGDPLGAAANARAQLAAGGRVLLVEPRAGDGVEDNLNSLGQTFYAASTLLCTAIALSQPGPDGAPSVALGAQAGPARLTEVLTEAGFSRVRVAGETPGQPHPGGATVTDTPGRDRSAPVRSPEAVPALGTVLGVWAHPDDETYLSGGLLAAAVAGNQRVVCATATRGEHGTDDPESYPPSRLARIREDELASALAILSGPGGAVAHRYLGDAPSARAAYVDAALSSVPPAHAVADVADLIADVQPDVVLTFGPDGMTGHPDHRAVSRWTTAAFARAAPAGARLLYATATPEAVAAMGDIVSRVAVTTDTPVSTPSSELAVHLQLTGELLERKLSALAAQGSQTDALRRALGEHRYRAFAAEEAFRPAGP